MESTEFLNIYWKTLTKGWLVIYKVNIRDCLQKVSQSALADLNVFSSTLIKIPVGSDTQHYDYVTDSFFLITKKKKSNHDKKCDLVPESLTHWYRNNSHIVSFKHSFEWHYFH